MIVVIRQGRANLCEAQVRVLPVNLLGIPVVRHLIYHNFYDLGRSACNDWHPIGSQGDMWICLCHAHIVLPLSIFAT